MSFLNKLLHVIAGAAAATVAAAAAGHSFLPGWAGQLVGLVGMAASYFTSDSPSPPNPTK